MAKKSSDATTRAIEAIIAAIPVIISVGQTIWNAYQGSKKTTGANSRKDSPTGKKGKPAP